MYCLIWLFLRKKTNPHLCSVITCIVSCALQYREFPHIHSLFVLSIHYFSLALFCFRLALEYFGLTKETFEGLVTQLNSN